MKPMNLIHKRDFVIEPHLNFSQPYSGSHQSEIMFVVGGYQSIFESLLSQFAAMIGFTLRPHL
jgi:hypothetical protein